MIQKLIVSLFLSLSLFFSSTSLWAVSAKEVKQELDAFKRVHEAQASNLAKAINQVQEIIAQFQSLQGQLDQSSYQNKNHQIQIEDATRRIEALEDKLIILTSQLEELKSVGLLPANQVKRLKEFQIYNVALSHINSDNYKEAINSLKAFIGKYARSPYAIYAQYWIAESYFALRDYPLAVAEFQKVVKQSPKHQKVPPSIFKQGDSFYKMNSFAEAKAFFSKLIMQFPKSLEANLAKERLQKIEEILLEKEKTKMMNEVQS